MTKLSWLTVFTTVTLTSQAFIIPSHGQSSYCSILAQGKLEPSAAVQKVQSPIDGMVKKVYVRNGDRVKTGDPLVQIESERSSALLTQLRAENQFYRSILLISGNRMSRAKLPQFEVLLNNREQNRLRRQNLVIQIEGAKTRIKAERARSAAATIQIDKQIAQNLARIIAARQTLTTNQSILADIRPAAREGAVARVQAAHLELDVKRWSFELEQQNQERDYLLAQKKYIVASYNNYESYQQEIIKEYQKGISRLDQEFPKPLKITENDKHIAENDFQINKIIIENERRIAVIMSRPQNPEYQEVRSPINGTVFELNTTPGLIIKPSTDQPLAKIVPEDSLIARVYIRDKDIGDIKNGMPVNVQVDSFNFAEFGDIKGTIESISPNALPPDQIFSYQRFPAKVKLNKQALNVNGAQIRLESGMSVSAYIQTKQCSR
jgi:hemolysin D